MVVDGEVNTQAMLSNGFDTEKSLSGRFPNGSPDPNPKAASALTNLSASFRIGFGPGYS